MPNQQSQLQDGIKLKKIKLNRRNFPGNHILHTHPANVQILKAKWLNTSLSRRGGTNSVQTKIYKEVCNSP